MHADSHLPVMVVGMGSKPARALALTSLSESR